MGVFWLDTKRELGSYLFCADTCHDIVLDSDVSLITVALQEMRSKMSEGKVSRTAQVQVV